MALETIANYILNEPQKIDNFDKKMKNEYISNHVSSIQDMQDTIECVAVNTDNYYKSNAQKLMPKDFQDPELKPLESYKQLKDTLVNQRDNGRETGKSKFFYNKMISLVNQDMVDIKDIIKRPVKLKNCSTEVADINWLDMDYLDEKHIREAMFLNKQSIYNDLGVLYFDIDRYLSCIKLSDKERALINYMRDNPDETQESVASKFGYKQPNIVEIISRTARKIQEYIISNELIFN